MDKIDFLHCLKNFTKEAVKDLRLPCRPDKGEILQEREVAVYLMNLPDMHSAEKKVPYVLHKLTSSTDEQTPGNQTKSFTTVRSIFAVYNPDAEIGSIQLLELLERVRVKILAERVIGKRYKLDMETGVQWQIYEDDISPFYAGEMISTWEIPTVEREYKQWLYGETKKTTST